MTLNKMWVSNRSLCIKVLSAAGVLLLLVAIGTLVGDPWAIGWQGVAMNGGESESPIACVLEALTGEKRKRRRVLVEQLSQTVTGLTELETGFLLQLRNDGSVREIAEELMVLEQKCCPFLEFALQGAHSGDSIWLSITGKDGVKEFLRQELALSKSASGAGT